MLKIITFLLFLLVTIDGFAHQAFDDAEDEIAINLNALPETTPPAIHEITYLLKLNKEVQPQKSLTLLNSNVPPASAMQLSWQTNQSLDGLSLATPVLVVNGAQTGPVLCLTAAVHGDELNGVEIVRRILHGIDPEKLSGTVIGVPIVNLQGFQRNSRYLTDRRDLNRFFPGNPQGNTASRIAHSFFDEIISHCNLLVDIHTGSFHRTNLPQIRGDLHYPEVTAFAQAFGIPVILHSEGSDGMLRHAAVGIGIPAVTLEAGESLTLQEPAIQHGVESIQILLNKLNMLTNTYVWNEPESIYYHSAWVRIDHGGILFSNVALGERIKKNKVLGIVTDPITNTRREIISPYNGQIIGKAVDQVVMPGFAGFHIGIKETEQKISKISLETKVLQTTPISTTLESE
jgi:predicted deacylase